MTWNDFKGAARQLDDIDLPKIGHAIGVGEDEIHAVMDVEAAGDGFDSQGRPRILFERHHFYRQLGKGAKRDRAIKQGLAVSRWSRASYSKDQYSLLTKAMKIDEAAALKSCSWGLGQVMGWNHELAGYDTVQRMVKSFMQDEEFHLQAMVEFIKSAGLDDNLRNHDWAGFARGYNGSGYKQNKYDTKLANAYRKWSRIKDTAWSPETVPLPDERIAEMESVINELSSEGRMSKGAIASAIGAGTGGLTLANNALTTAETAQEIADKASGLNWTLVALVVITGLCIFLGWDRIKYMFKARAVK